MNLRPYAKALAGALVALLVYVIGHVGLELPAEVVGSLEAAVTGWIVWQVRNRPKEA